MVTDPVIAVACSDVHLSLKPPVARAGEKSWLDAQARVMFELTSILSAHPQSVLLVAGDLFDRWNAPAELITWALRHLPKRVLGIPGNHDLPSHLPELAHKSAWGTLVAAGRIADLTSFPIQVNGACFYGAPLNGPMPVPGTEELLHVCLVHEFVYTKDTGYQGAPEEALLGQRAKRYLGFDVVVVGDNHKHFSITIGGTRIVNCGTLTRRKSDEARYRPRVALIHRSGVVDSFDLETQHDHITELVHSEKEQVSDAKVEKLLAELERDDRGSVDFRDELERAVRKGVRREVRKVLRSVLDAL